MRVFCALAGLCNGAIYDTVADHTVWSLHGAGLNGIAAIGCLLVWLTAIALEEGA
jgi:hypothetical protein